MKFIVYGKPQGKGRPRFARRGKFVTTYTPEKTKAYEEEVVTECIRQCKSALDCEYDGAIKMKIWAYFEPAKSVSKKKYSELLGQANIHKPDFDNIAKIICDSLNGIAYKDDNQISDIEIYKRYDNTARVEVEIEYMR